MVTGKGRRFHMFTGPVSLNISIEFKLVDDFRTTFCALEKEQTGQKRKPVQLLSEPINKLLFSASKKPEKLLDETGLNSPLETELWVDKVA